MSQINTLIKPTNECNMRCKYCFAEKYGYSDSILDLKILKKYNAKATFFVTGCHQEYNQYIIEAYKQGHTIGLHSYLHEYQDIQLS